MTYGLDVLFEHGKGMSCQVEEELLKEKDCQDYIRLNSSGDPSTFICQQRLSSPAESYSVSELLQGAQMYQLSPRLMALPCGLNSTRKFRLDPDGFGLGSLLDDILGYDVSLFSSIQKSFVDYFPQFSSVRIETQKAVHRDYQESGIHHYSEAEGKGIYFKLKSGDSIRAQQASDGVILLLGFLALMHTPTPPKILLIEEPETGIYPKRLAEVIKLLKRFATEYPNAPQIIMTTHSPYLLSFFEPDEVTFMQRKDASTVVARPLRDAPNIRERMEGGFYLGELWYNLSEEELFGNA